MRRNNNADIVVVVVVVVDAPPPPPLYPRHRAVLQFRRVREHHIVVRIAPRGAPPAASSVLAVEDAQQASGWWRSIGNIIRPENEAQNTRAGRRRGQDAGGEEGQIIDDIRRRDDVRRRDDTQAAHIGTAFSTTAPRGGKGRRRRWRRSGRCRAPRPPPPGMAGERQRPADSDLAG